MSNFDNPWLGLKSYEEDDKLYGRDKETSELSNIIINSFHTTIYGKSGIGKTSLLKAGVFPNLRYEDFFPVYIRLEHSPSNEMGIEYYLSQIENAIIKSSQNIDYTRTGNDNKALSSIFNSFHLTTSRGIELTPVYVFDQFEEIFTLNNDKGIVDEFFKLISPILNNCDVESNYRILFCLREDYLYYIERYSKVIPAFKRNRYCLQELSQEEAFEIITLPQKHLVDDYVAYEILNKLTYKKTCEVNATILSLYMSQLYEKMVKVGAISISSDIVSQFGDDIISSFYLENIKGITKKNIAYLEDHLVTTGGYRHNLPLEDVLAGGVKEEELFFLKGKRIINFQTRDNAIQYIEFTHDVLCPIIVQHRTDRIIQERAKKTKVRIFLYSMIIIVAFGIMTLLAWQEKNRYKLESKNKKVQLQKEVMQSQKEEAEARSDSIQQLNVYLKNQQDSILKLKDNLAIEKRKVEMRLANEHVLTERLRKKDMENSRQKEEINLLYKEVRHSYEVLEKSYKELKKEYEKMIVEKRIENIDGKTASFGLEKK